MPEQTRPATPAEAQETPPPVRRGPRDWAPAALVLLLGTVLAALVFIELLERTEERVERRVRAAVEERLELLANSAARSLEVLHGLSAFLAVAEPSRDEFRSFVRESLERLPQVQALEWIPRVPLAERERLEVAARADGLSDFRFTEIAPSGQLATALARAEYYPVYYAEPTHRNRRALGLDLASDPARGAALRRAAATGEAVASAPVRLAQEQRSGQLGYLVFAPIHDERGAASLAGFALAVFRVESLARPAFESLPAKDFAVTLRDVTDSDLVLAEFGGPLSDPRPDATQRATLALAGRQLALELTPSAAFVASHVSGGLWGYPACLLALALGSSLYLLGSSRREREIEHQVAVRTHMNERLSAEITIRREAQRQAAKAHKAKSHFLASMSHEIRTPLNAIVGYAQLLHHDPDSPLAREGTEVMLQSSLHLLTLIDDILDLSRVEAGHIVLSQADFDLESVVSSLGFLFRHKCEQRGLRLSVEGLTGQARWVRGDEAKLRQILINLLGNAVKFTESGGVVLAIAAEGPTTVAFEVRDTGPGIDVEDQAHIFDNFRQGKNARPGTGTGLGLAISRQLVELMGGRLELESAVGSGATFRFSVQFESPMTVAPSQSLSRVPRARLAPGTRCRCLVVDDLEVNRRLLCQILDALGCTTLGVASGEEALERAQGFGPDLVFMDVLMPQMDGFQATRELLERGSSPSPRVVAFSASVLQDERAAYLSAGFDGFLPKPFRLQQVSECIASLLDVRFVAEREEPAPGDRVGPAEPIPMPLLAELKDAARLYQATRLKQLLVRLEGLGPEHARLAQRLKGLADVYDMPGVARAIELEAVAG
jgi:signal transduction histidine kinase